MLNDDYELSRLDILELSSRDALAAFFAKLGYATNDRLVQRASAMGFSSDTLKAAITHIERIASEEGGLLEVYLVELRSVTVATTRALVNAFRNLSVLFPLLVLTDDYQRLDFVLVERYSSPINATAESAPPGLPAAAPQVGVRPRTLTINRQKPGEVELRVLRRFSFTESDTFAQNDKLLSAYDVADWSEPFFNNRALFSDYYLTTRLAATSQWQDPAETTAMTRAFKQLRQLYAGVRETFANQPAPVMRTKLLEPVLTALGFTPQPITSSAGNTVSPHYKLYAAVPIESTNVSNTNAPVAGYGRGLPPPWPPASPVESRDASKPLALCLAYAWGRNLDGKDEQRDTLTPDANPGAIVVSLLDNPDCDWASVTNYYEIDLEETLALPAANIEAAFPYFWHFFRAAAFIPGQRAIEGEKRPLCFLDTLVSESERYARELGERLKKRVFEDIFPHFARGFIIYARRNGQLPPDMDTMPAGERARLLEPFFSGTLTFLYRLLFLLYAESRDLLPVREARGYSEKSLEKLKRQVAEKAGPTEDSPPVQLKDAYNELSTAFYDRLQELFAAVDKGESSLNVPVYNGGLFITHPDPADASPEAAVARFLSTCKIPDRQLALGLDRMARDLDEKKHDLAFIDYKSLGVRQLGSIYEGLLEFQLRIAPEVLAVVKGKKTEEYVPYAEAQKQKLPILKEGRGKDTRDKTYPRGHVYLENDRHERKATGSYYTPDYIVKYIVQHTVGPILDEKLQALRPLFREAEKTLRGKRDREAALKKQHLLTRGDDAERETYNHYKDTLNKAFFDIKVLDPAMGSGHFLVEAVDYITDRVADFLTAFRWNPVVYELEQTRREIAREMEQQGVTIDMSKLTDLNLLKRRVLKSCIYGVDLNPMAVELAKVSLWLDCFTLGAPLSFLDHHMKCGNSLIGGNVQEVEEAVSVGLWGSQFVHLLGATQMMLKVGELSDVTAQEVAASRAAYKGAYDALAPFKRLLDVWTSEHFAIKGAKRITQDNAGAIYYNDYSETDKGEKQVIEAALNLATTKRFFHWELEFPEVFFDESKRKESGGFDAVVGNPPYDELSEDAIGRVIDEETFLTTDSLYKILGGGRLNWYHYFILLALTVVRSSGMHGFIVPMSLMSDQFTLSLRRWIMENHQLVALEAFPQKDNPNKRIFFEAKLPTCIYLVSNERSSRPFQVRVHPANIIDVASPTYYPDVATLKTLDSANLSIPQVSEKGWQVLKKIVKDTRLGKLSEVGAKPTSGEIVFNQQFRKYLTEDDSYTLILRGSHVQRYELADEAKQGEPVYLKKGLYLQEAKPGSKAFDHLKERVVYQEGAAIDNWRRIIATLLPPGLICGHKICYFIDYKIAPTALLAIFDCRLVDWYITALSTNNSLSAYLVGSIRFPRFNMTLPEKERAYYLEKARNLYAYCLDKRDQDCVLGFVDYHLARVPEESDVVHDLLAMLAEEMMRLNKEKRAVQRAFLDWLVATLKIAPDKEGRKGIDALTGKSKLLDYPGDYQKAEPPLAPEALLEILQKNKARLGVSLSDTALADRVKREYESSLERVLPLKERLEQTDRLIDAVVYRLYGLTEEEIRVVEGKV